MFHFSVKGNCAVLSPDLINPVRVLVLLQSAVSLRKRSAFDFDTSLCCCFPTKSHLTYTVIFVCLFLVFLTRFDAFTIGVWHLSHETSKYRVWSPADQPNCQLSAFQPVLKIKITVKIIEKIILAGKPAIKNLFENVCLCHTEIFQIILTKT